MDNEKRRGCGRSLWHPALVEALRLELEAFEDDIVIVPESPLNAAPFVMDALVIKKKKEAAIGKNIALIFREYNIIEYKSPKSYVSVADFIKVYAYACLYAVLNGKDLRDISITFVENRYPRRLFAYLREVWGLKAEEAMSGIYHVSGDKIAMQVICRKGLSCDENLWLSGLGDDLDAEKLSLILAEGEKKASALSAYMNVVCNANSKVMEEVLGMKMRTGPGLRKVFEEAGWIQEWLAQGRTEGEAERERLQLEIERLKQENAALKRAARQKA